MDSGCSSEKSASIISLDELLETAPCNKTIGDNLIRAWSIINNPKYKKICCSISGGSDSDIVLDICTKVDIHHKITYVFFDTGLEYRATREHIKRLEEKYGVEIKTCKAIKPIPLSCNQYGQPFLSKQVSEFVQRLQRYNFQWKDEDFDTLYEKYPKCKSALMWWCNRWESNKYNIRHNKWLKEFLIVYPPTFKISNKCCKYAKKDAVHKYMPKSEYDLQIYGVRKAEGGARSGAYKNCYTVKDDGYDFYRPIFFYKNDDKACYEQHYGIDHSRCYTQYGLKRTGCVGCPFGRNLEQELEATKLYEPKLYNAVCNVFKDSYEYTRQYRQFCDEMNRKSKAYHQLTLSDFI